MINCEPMINYISISSYMKNHVFYMLNTALGIKEQVFGTMINEHMGESSVDSRGFD